MCLVKTTPSSRRIMLRIGTDPRQAEPVVRDSVSADMIKRPGLCTKSGFGINQWQQSKSLPPTATNFKAFGDTSNLQGVCLFADQMNRFMEQSNILSPLMVRDLYCVPPLKRI
jgi:hypothetical protein